MVTLDLPPGILYLLRYSPKLAFPPILTVFLVYTLQARADVHTSAWIVALLAFLSSPLFVAARVSWKQFRNKREAARRGAIMIPVLPTAWPAGLDALWNNLKTFRKGYMGDGFDDVVKKVGGYIFNSRVLYEDRIVTVEPEHLKAILATQFDEFEKGEEVRYILHPLLGTGVFAADGDLWKFHRTMTRPFFTRERISHFDTFDRHAEDAISQLRARLQEGHPVDFQDLVGRFTVDSASEFLFGHDVQSLSGVLPYPFYVNAQSKTSTEGSPLAQTGGNEEKNMAIRFVKALAECQVIMAVRMRFGVHWPLMEFWHDTMKEHVKIAHDFINPIVAQAIQRKREMEANGLLLKDRDDETLLENLVNSTEDPITLRDEIMSLLVAGRDTTAGTLTFCVYMLAEHPEVLRRLRQEILEKVGPHRRPTYDDFREMKYLKAVINETLRLYPVVPMNMRMSSANGALLPNMKTRGGSPYFVPPNTRIPYPVVMMHRRTDLWGPDALEFDPDRFLDERLHKYLTPNPFIFLPFNAGPRICLGQQFAYNEISYFLVRLLQAFSAIALVQEAQPPDSRPPPEWAQDKNSRKAREKIRPKTHLTLYVQGGLWVTMRQADETEKTC